MAIHDFPLFRRNVDPGSGRAYLKCPSGALIKQRSQGSGVRIPIAGDELLLIELRDISTFAATSACCVPGRNW